MLHWKTPYYQLSKKIFSMIERLAFFLLLLSIGHPTLAQQEPNVINGNVINYSSIDALVQKLMDTAGVTGLCLGIISDNKVDYVRSYGYKNKEKRELIDNATCFYAASLAKPLF